MQKPLAVSWWTEARPVIGMLHAPPLPGSPRYDGDWAGVVRHVLADLEALTAAGVQGLMLENFGDAPFFPDRVPGETIACLTRLAVEVRSRTELPLGINVLRNDGVAAIAVAAAADADFVRVNVLCGARVTDQGLLQGNAHEVLRARERLGARHIQILADVDVKHSAPLAPRPLAEEVEETLARGGADAIIVSGTATGALPDLQHVQAAKRAARSAPVIVGSGATSASLPELWPHADAFIIGSSFKADGVAANPIIAERVREVLAVRANLLRS
ncbi:MAG: BtpA/SgcQ family protein [Planctomycetaceae bacterium]|nr:BtpA/SgcQ family protein [Planctomycetaceae bacterium]